MITKEKLQKLYERVRLGLPGADLLTDLDIFRLVCEEDGRQPFDLDWWNGNYIDLHHASLEVREAWHLAQQHNAQNPLMNFGGEEAPDHYDDSEIPN